MSNTDSDVRADTKMITSSGLILLQYSLEDLSVHNTVWELNKRVNALDLHS